MENKKKERFKLDAPEKSARLDIRLADSLRQELEAYCKPNRKKLTTAITEALKDYLEKHQKK
jgi:hypothetical protein